MRRVARLLPDQRRAIILQRLESHGAVSVAELARTLGVSAMTVHRDLAELARQGKARKVRGGAVGASASAGPTSPGADRCAFCSGPLQHRTVFVVRRPDGRSETACCAHCGLLLLDGQDRSAVAAALTPDFLFGHRVNALAAFYLVAPELSLCCSPAVLAFERLQDAERFRLGFGGEVCGFEQAAARLRAVMAVHSRRHA